jgi:hypothetical protein
VSTRGHHDDAGVAGCGQRVVQTGGQREMAEVVGAELGLPALRGPAVRGVHHAGVVHQDVERSVPGGGERVDTRQIGEIELFDDDVGATGGVGDVGGDRHLGAGVGEGPGGLHADAGGPAGDDRAPARQVDSVDDLQGRAGAAELAADPCHAAIVTN